MWSYFKGIKEVCQGRNVFAMQTGLSATILQTYKMVPKYAGLNNQVSTLQNPALEVVNSYTIAK